MKIFLNRALEYLKNVVLADFGIALFVAGTFLIAGPFSFIGYSERIFWAGVAITMIAAVVGVAAMFSGRSFGIPVIIRRPAEAKRLLDNFEDYRDLVEKRYDASIQIFVVGLGCIGISALVQTFLS